MTVERKCNRNKKRDRQSSKVARGNQQLKEDEKNSRSRKYTEIPPLQAKNERQKEAFRLLDTKQLTVLSGSAGSGKTMLASYFASKEWLKGNADNIIITRPNKSMNGDNAAIPGSDFLKTLPYTMAILSKLKMFLGAGVLKNNLRQEMQDVLFNDVSGIQVYSMEKLNGLSFDEKTVIIADEVQSATVGQVKALLTRLESGARMVVCGDPLQSAIKGENGLDFLLSKVEQYPHEDIGVVKFLPEDCCRTGVSAHFTEIFEKEGKWDKN